MLGSGQTVEACLGGLVVSLVPLRLSTWHTGSYTMTSPRQLQSQRDALMAFSAVVSMLSSTDKQVIDTYRLIGILSIRRLQG